MANKKEKEQFYSLKNIKKENADYNLIIGERSNGKTYAVLEEGLNNFIKSHYKEQLAIIRRWTEDFTGKRGGQMFKNLVDTELVKKLTNGEWESITYRSSKWFLSRYDEKTDTDVLHAIPLAFGFALGAGEHDKSSAFPGVTTILFDEFITRTRYLPDEFIMFTNVLSTIIRKRDNVKIYMCGNTVNKYCPYFNEMGLKNIKDMEQGTIDLYTYGESGLKVAVEYCSPTKKGKKSDKYFAFDNPKLKMITEGAWELELYPHLPIKYRYRNIVLTYFIEFDKELLQCEIIQVKDEGRVCYFTYIHRKTSDLKDLPNDIIYSPTYSHKPNWRRVLGGGQDNADNIIFSFFTHDKVFYQDNEVGELVRNYLLWCGKQMA